MNTMFTDWYGKRVILFVATPGQIHYVGTLKKAEGPLIKLTNITPMREARAMPDMIVNLTCSKYSHLELVVNPEDDPTNGKNGQKGDKK